MCKIINHSRFKHFDEIADEHIELETNKQFVRNDVPIQIGFFVLEYAKLLMLSFYYDFLIKYIPFQDFALIQTDTDSLYFSLSKKSLFLAISKEKRAEFMIEYGNWFAKDFCDNHENEFFRAMFENKRWDKSQCCEEASKFDLRTVGKFHIEWMGGRWCHSAL